MSDEAKAPEVTAKTSDVVTVSPENMDAFNSERLGLNTEPAPEVVEPVESTEAIEGELVDEPADEPEHKEEKTEKPKKKNSFQERISEVTAEKNAAKAELDRERAEAQRLRQELEALKKPAESKEPQDQPQALKKPDINTYTDVAQYEADLTAYNREMFKAEQRAEAAAQAQLKLEQTWDEKKAAFIAETPDYEEVLGNSNLQISDVVKEAIVESDIGPQLAYHLATNPEVAAHLKTLSLARQAAEIGRIEASLAKPTTEAAKPSVQVSKAPQPISPIKSAATTMENKVDADGNFHGTPEEFKKLRLAGKIK